MGFKEENMGGRMAERITELLYEKNMTQKELALAANVTESTVSHYIKGDRVPRGVNLVKIAKALETTTDYLLEQDRGYNRESDIKLAKTIIARNAQELTKNEKIELVSLLMGDD